MKAYKVLRKTRDGRLTSLIVRGEAEVTYGTGAYVRGCPGTGLFCFGTLGGARDFGRVWGMEDKEIWKVSARGLRRRVRILSAHMHIRFTCARLKLAWEARNQLRRPQAIWVVAREVKLLEKVA